MINFMKKLFLTYSIVIACLFAQNTMAQDETVDTEVKKCLAEDSDISKVLGKEFGFVRWQASLDFFTRKTIQRMSSEHTIEIARLRQESQALATLSESCNYLSKAKKDLKIIAELYEKIEVKKEKNAFGEEIITQAIATKKLIEKMKKSLDNIRKNYGIKQVYYRSDEIPDEED